jgi:hypothetical protein
MFPIALLVTNHGNPSGWVVVLAGKVFQLSKRFRMRVP